MGEKEKIARAKKVPVVNSLGLDYESPEELTKPLIQICHMH